MAVDYLTLAELKATLSLSSETYADADIGQSITAASRAVDQYCDRFFWKDTSDATRKYTPIASDFVYVDDLSQAPTSVTSQGTTLVRDTDYALASANGSLDGEPYERLVAVAASFARFVPDSLVVVGKFGWPAIPSQVKTATTILATRLLRRAREAAFGVVGVGFEGIAVRIVAVDPDLRMLLGPLRKSVPFE